MDTLFKTGAAVLAGFGIFTVLNLIPIVNSFSLLMGVLGGLGTGIYLMSRGD